MKEKTVDTKLIYKGKILDVHLDTVVLPNNNQALREVVIHQGAVAVVAITEDDEVLLVKQFRYPVGEVLWEIPAGKLEQKEEPLDCAKRELAEETGFGAENWYHLSDFYTSPGFSNELMHLYLAFGLYENKKTADEDEFIEIHPCSFKKAIEMIATGEIKDAKTIAGILMAINKRKELQL